MPYRYVENIDVHNRYSQVIIALDNGSNAILHQGGVYNLSSSELARARRYIVLADSDIVPEPFPDPGGGGSGGGSVLITEANEPDIDPTTLSSGTIWHEIV